MTNNFLQACIPDNKLLQEKAEELDNYLFLYVVCVLNIADSWTRDLYTALYSNGLFKQEIKKCFNEFIAMLQTLLKYQINRTGNLNKSDSELRSEILTDTCDYFEDFLRHDCDKLHNVILINIEQRNGGVMSPIMAQTEVIRCLVILANVAYKTLMRDAKKQTTYDYSSETSELNPDRLLVSWGRLHTLIERKCYKGTPFMMNKQLDIMKVFDDIKRKVLEGFYVEEVASKVIDNRTQEEILQMKSMMN